MPVAIGKQSVRSLTVGINQITLSDSKVGLLNYRKLAFITATQHAAEVHGSRIRNAVALADIENRHGRLRCGQK